MKATVGNSSNTKKSKGIVNCIAVNITIYLYFIQQAAYRETFQKTIHESVFILLGIMRRRRDVEHLFFPPHLKSGVSMS